MDLWSFRNGALRSEKSPYLGSETRGYLPRTSIRRAII